ncbi:MAG: hypothetical protein PVJ02_08550 [Gemmatimonadota bacterium]|jgi:hypothetical protein
MKRLRTAVVVSLLALAPAAAAIHARSAPLATRTPVARVTGAGFWDQVACGTCLAGYLTMSTMGWGALSDLVFTAGDGACLDACLAAL